MPGDLCLLTVHAHPDDEASKGPATIARYHAEGVKTVLVCCTGGEEGDVLNPAMDKPEIRSNLAAVRRRELFDSAKIIGYDEVVLLGYRDSGMPGSEANARPDAFANASLDDAVGRLVAIVRRTRPQVMVTYPAEQNEYPHPDHLRAHAISVAAFDAAGDPDAFGEAGPPWAPVKLYYTTWPRERARQMHAKFLELGLDSPFQGERLERMMRDTPVTTKIALTGYTDVRSDALRAHATQVDPTSPYWFGLPPDMLRTIYPFDDYVLARGRLGSDGRDDAVEEDLFAGAR